MLSSIVNNCVLFLFNEAKDVPDTKQLQEMAYKQYSAIATAEPESMFIAQHAMHNGEVRLVTVMFDPEPNDALVFQMCAGEDEEAQASFAITTLLSGKEFNRDIAVSRFSDYRETLTLLLEQAGINAKATEKSDSTRSDKKQTAALVLKEYHSLEHCLEDTSSDADTDIYLYDHKYYAKCYQSASDFGKQIEMIRLPFVQEHGTCIGKKIDLVEAFR